MQEVTKNASRVNNSIPCARTADETGFKKCVKCGSLKSLSDFSKSTNRKDGHSPYCKLCHREYGKQKTINKRKSIISTEIPDLPNEIWQNIEGYEDCYQVSNLGRVKSLDRIIPHKGHETQHIKGKICKGKIIKAGGYVVVNISKNNNGKWIKVHQLVAKAFIPNPENKREIDHINTIPTDNRVENLRWATRTENANNILTRQKNASSSKNKKCNVKLTKEQIIEIKEQLSENNYRGIQTELAKKFNISITQINRIKLGKIWND
jgi:hypothetical protein